MASRLGVSAPSVSKWSQRFDREGLGGLKDQPGRGPKPSIPLATVQRVVEEAGQAPPGRQRWSTRSLAEEVGISADSVAPVWMPGGSMGHSAAAIESTWIVLVSESSVPTTVTFFPANSLDFSWSLNR